MFIPPCRQEEGSFIQGVYSLPLLRDQIHSVATVQPVVDKVRDTVRLLNPGQVPVI